jgi:UPF0755 protein
MKAALILFLVLLAAAGGYIAYGLAAPYAGFEKEVFLEFPLGTGTNAIARELERAGIVRNRWVFLAARALRRDATLQAGEYRFHYPASPLVVYDRIARGDVFYYELLVPEGQNIFDIAASAGRLGLFTREAFLQAARDPAMIRDLAPEAPSLDGYLFPDRYRLTRQTTPEQLARQMTARFREVWKSLGAPPDAHRVVTLASLVEKESKLPEDRRLIAAVFTNRLRIGMKLDCDPTTIYAALLEGRYRGEIYRSDLDRKSLWNTYRTPGLPPGPIANPGIESLRAALSPADTNALYFVLRPDGSGGHKFSASLAEHQVAASAYRRAQRSR